MAEITVRDVHDGWISALVAAPQPAQQEAVTVHLRFAAPHKVDGGFFHYIAANPPNKTLGFNGSCLPFANWQQAMEGSANHGQGAVDSEGTSVITLDGGMPNSFHDRLGDKVPPCLFITYTTNGVTQRNRIPLSDGGIPFRDTLLGKRAKAESASLLYDVVTTWESLDADVPATFFKHMAEHGSYMYVHHHLPT